MHTLKDTCVSTFLPLAHSGSQPHTLICVDTTYPHSCAFTHIYTHTQEYVPTRPRTHLVAMTLFISDPWALTDTCRSARTHKHRHRVKRKPPADCPRPQVSPALGFPPASHGRPLLCHDWPLPGRRSPPCLAPVHFHLCGLSGSCVSACTRRCTAQFKANARLCACPVRSRAS